MFTSLVDFLHVADLLYIITFRYNIIGASLSEPHIDGDVRPTSRGMFVYMYVSGRVVRLSSHVPEKSRARTH